MKRPDIKKLEQTSKELRIDILKMLHEAGSGHTGGSLSSVEIYTALYFYKMRHDSKKPQWPDRDRFVLSKGHGCPALYVTLAHCGYFGKDALKGLRKLGSKLQGHPSKDIPGVEISSGSLGQGLSVAGGMALSAKLDRGGWRVFCLLGDGETHEGQIWEAAMTAGHYKLDNLCAIVDNNKYCIDGKCEDIKNIEPFADKWRSFGWHAIEADGHDVKKLMDALDEASTTKKKPTVIIADTIKGKGVSFIENNNKWHGIAPSKEELERALKELK